MKKLLTTKQVAELLQLNPRKVYQLVSNKEIPFVKIGSCVRFEEESIEKWISEKQID